MSVYPELDDLTADELVGRFHGPPIDGDDYGYIFFSEVAFTLRQRGEEGNYLLWKELNSTLDEERLMAVIFGLSCPPSIYLRTLPLEDSVLTEFKKRLMVLLYDDRPDVCAQVIDALAYLHENDCSDEVLKFQDAQSPYVRGAVVRYLARLFPERAVSHLLKCLKDPHFVVRENAIDELDDLDATEAIPYIRQLLTDEHPDVRQAAETALENLMDSSPEA